MGVAGDPAEDECHVLELTFLGESIGVSWWRNSGGLKGGSTWALEASYGGSGELAARNVARARMNSWRNDISRGLSIERTGSMVRCVCAKEGKDGNEVKYGG